MSNENRPPLRTTPAAHRRLFLSCVSHEFRAYRDVLAATLAQPGVELRRQEDFINAGRTTLEKLSEYIRTCDAVIHLVGHATGAYPETPAVDRLLTIVPDFVSKLRLADLMTSPGLSYTQWEAWLALYHGKPLALYHAADVAEREAGFAPDPAQRRRQELHWNRLKSLGWDRKEFVSPSDLSIEVLRAMPSLVPGFSENVRRGEFRDRNLLFAVLARQDKILSDEDFVRVCKIWADDIDQPISEVMDREDLLTSDQHLLIEARMELQLKHHGGDVRMSLADSLNSDARNSLVQALDTSTLASLPDMLAGFRIPESLPGHWRYRLTRLHASGGLGVVYAAEDESLERSVAVKQMRPERMLDPMALERFRREAKITGQLQHPNIVPVYELGLNPDDQIPFYSMRFIGHRTLHDAITQLRADKTSSPGEYNLRFRSLLQSFIAVCNAVAYAHEQQIIHRDLKPDNVMIGDFGEVILLDWGLAKHIGEAEPPPLTDAELASGNAEDLQKTKGAIGSPAYMAPEQAAGQVDLHGPHTDIYGLGVTLYELLTGDVPFTGSTTEELYAAIQSPQLLPDPRERDSSIHPGLAAICRKTMAKRIEDRYPTAKALADDLQHWLADEPVTVLADRLPDRLARIGRKHRGVVATVLAASVLIALGSTLAALIVNHQRQVNADLAKQKSKLAADKTVLVTQLEEQSENLAREVQRATEANEELQQQIYIAQITQASGKLQVGDYLAAEQILAAIPWSRRGWEYRYLWRECEVTPFTLRGHTAHVTSVSFSPDRIRLASASDDRTIKVWDVQTGAELQSLSGHTGRVTSVSFSPDGTRLSSASADRTLKVWDVQTGAELQTLRGHDEHVLSVSFNPDGTRLASASADRTIKLWDAETGTELITLHGHTERVNSVSFSPEGTRLASGSDNGSIMLWDVRSGTELLALDREGRGITSVSFSPDGTRLASASMDGEIEVWDAKTGAELRRLDGGTSLMLSAGFSPDGSRIAGATGDKVMVWDVRTGVELQTLRGHKEEVVSVSFSPDGTRLASASWDGTIKVWYDRNSAELLTFGGHKKEVISVSFSLDGTRLASASFDRTIKVWDAQSGAELQSLSGHTGRVTSVSFSPDGTRLASASMDGKIKVWDVQTGAELQTLRGHDEHVLSVSFNPDGTWLASASEDRTVKVWDVRTGAELQTLRGHDERVTSVSFNPDGTRLASASMDGKIKVWDAKTGAELITHHGYDEFVFAEYLVSVSFSPDGTRLASTSKDLTVKVWDARTGAELFTLYGPKEEVTSVTFSPDGNRLASRYMNNTIKVWDAWTGAELLTFQGHNAGATSMRFTPDGILRLAGANGNKIAMWDARTGAELLTLRAHAAEVSSVSFTKDATRLVSSDKQGTRLVWLLTQGDLQRSTVIPDNAELTAQSPDPLLRAIPHGYDVQLIRRNPNYDPWAEDVGLRRRSSPKWHAEDAEKAEQAKNWYAAAFHLRWLLDDKPDDVALKQRHDTALAKLKEQNITPPLPHVSPRK